MPSSPRFTDETLHAFRDLSTASVADAVEAHGARGFVSGAVRQQTPGTGSLVGPAVTVREVPADAPEPPTHALAAIDESAPGSVVCIDAAGADIAVWGGLMTAGAVARGIAGAVLDAGVRDVTEISRDYPGFPVYARSAVPATTVGRYRTVSLNEPVLVGGVTIRPGDLVVADRDGVVRVPAELVDDVLRTASEIEEREREQTRLILDSGSLRDGLAKYNRI
ncbi:RraA family protein [Streptomyces tubbatahanensis]|uniref:Putative 4-hydroxy-4-methyl-2-oxoglutarate aldolase n=1 Tax=Streptomyces tubbatahanensis TaxID=2923272 RepID=A0ABY3XLK6_9ACTN|nr:RraA family protein [Streptomyces tubbatahanensis]UNS95342.1 RraA family protein [Streptomyces tubbatahanensis]